MEINKFYRKGKLVIECRKRQKAFEIMSCNPGFLVVEFEAETLIDLKIRYKPISEIELENEKRVGEYIEDVLQEKVTAVGYPGIKKLDSFNKLRLV